MSAAHIEWSPVRLAYTYFLWIVPSFISSSDDQPYIPPTKPYELSHLAADLVLLGRYLLKPNGRLVFFLPTVTDEYEEVDIHTMLCDGMEVIANSLQDFGSWGRRVCCIYDIYFRFSLNFTSPFQLVTIRKTTSKKYPPPSFDPIPPVVDENAHIPAHKDFREKYFQGFKSKTDEFTDGIPASDP